MGSCPLRQALRDKHGASRRQVGDGRGPSACWRRACSVTARHICASHLGWSEREDRELGSQQGSLNQCYCSLQLLPLLQARARTERAESNEMKRARIASNVSWLLLIALLTLVAVDLPRKLAESNSAAAAAAALPSTATKTLPPPARAASSRLVDCADAKLSLALVCTSEPVPCPVSVNAAQYSGPLSSSCPQIQNSSRGTSTSIRSTSVGPSS